MRKSNLCTKSLDVQFKAADVDTDKGEFTAYASVFGNKDSYGDVVMKGAFADTLADWAKSGNTIPLLYNHDMSDPFSNIGGVTKAEEDDHGLKVAVKMDLDNPKAAQVFRLVKAGRLSQMSFAFDVLEGGEAKREKAGGADGETEYVYELRKLKLYEVSAVPIGANQETEILAVKAAIDATQKRPNGLTAQAAKALRGTLTAALAALDAEFPQGQEPDTDATEAAEKAAPEGPSLDSDPTVAFFELEAAATAFDI